MLNAFRHHRGRHTVNSVLLVIFPRAQRLSASQRSAPEAKARSLPMLWRAQRLSASQRSAHLGRDVSRRRRPVLNAFRHHRGRHPIRRTLFRQDDKGAQRLSASQRSAHQSAVDADSASSCSTPFGITEVGTEKSIHQTIASGVCSTPFGITEVGTSAASAASAAECGAQRLSASQRSAHSSFVASPGPPIGAQRLSASQRSALDL